MENEGIERRLYGDRKMRYFVWTQGLRGPTPQIWDEKEKTWEGKKIKTLTSPIEFNDDRDLDQLAKDYPYV